MKPRTRIALKRLSPNPNPDHPRENILQNPPTEVCHLRQATRTVCHRITQQSSAEGSNRAVLSHDAWLNDLRLAEDLAKRLLGPLGKEVTLGLERILVWTPSPPIALLNPNRYQPQFASSATKLRVAPRLLTNACWYPFPPTPNLHHYTLQLQNEQIVQPCARADKDAIPCALT